MGGSAYSTAAHPNGVVGGLALRLTKVPLQGILVYNASAFSIGAMGGDRGLEWIILAECHSNACII